MSEQNFSKLPADELRECRAKIDEALKAKAIADLRARYKEMARTGWCQHLAHTGSETWSTCIGPAPN
jgi:hypothetical protein